MLDNIFDEIEKANAIVILTHEIPDGDAVSSCLAFGMLLKGKADIIIPTSLENFSFLPGTEMVKTSGDRKYDLAIALDCANAKRLIGYEEYFKNAKKTVSIDHHKTNEGFADLNYVIDNAPSCTQILTNIFKSKNLKIDNNIATCLVAGIISDTSGLSERNITANTFEAITFLLGFGVNYNKIYENIMKDVSIEKFRLKQLVVGRVKIEGKIATSYLKESDITSLDVVDNKYLLREYQNIEGVVCIVFFVEWSGMIKVSLRSKGIDVSKICEKYKGGGHKESAGCKIEGTLEEVRQIILKELS